MIIMTLVTNATGLISLEDSIECGQTLGIEEVEWLIC